MEHSIKALGEIKTALQDMRDAAIYATNRNRDNLRELLFSMSEEPVIYKDGLLDNLTIHWDMKNGGVYFRCLSKRVTINEILNLNKQLEDGI